MYTRRISIAHRAVDYSRHILSTLHPRRRAERARFQALRDACERVMAELVLGCTRRFEGTVLIDGMFDNPNFWFRLSLLRAGIGLAEGTEVGLLGPFATRECRRTFANLGIGRVIRHDAYAPGRRDVFRRAQALVAATHTADDILDWELPEGVPVSLVYDGMLKRQRRGSVDIHDPNFERYVVDALLAIETGRYILDDVKPDLVVPSHLTNFTYGSLTWLAVARGIPVVLNPFGGYGSLRFVHITRRDQMFTFYDRPTPAQFAALPPEKVERLAVAGRAYLSARLDGRADDVAAVITFRQREDEIDREKLSRQFGWDAKKRVVAVYASNYFDFPHKVGMSRFRDFEDWIVTTHAAAKANPAINWLFKAHPLDEHYGGITLTDIISETEDAPHVRLAENSWNNSAVIGSVDALVTYHGTAGIEFTSRSTAAG